MTKLMKYKNFLIGIVGALVLVAAWYFLLWKPQYNSLASKREKVDAFADERDKLNVELAQLKALKRQESELKRDLAKLRLAVPDGPELEEFLFQLSETAATAGVSIQSATFAPPSAAVAAPATGAAAPAGSTAPAATPTATTAPAAGAPAAPAATAVAPASPVSVMQITLSLNGTYPQLLDFLDLTEVLSRAFVFDSVNVTGGTEGALTIQVIGRIFTTAPPEGAAGGAPATSGAPPAGGTASGTPAPPTGAPANSSPTPPAAPAPGGGP